jgi:hypothetical protein
LVDLVNLLLLGVTLDHSVCDFCVLFLLVQPGICVFEGHAWFVKAVIAIACAARVKHFKFLKTKETALFFAEQCVGE